MVFTFFSLFSQFPRHLFTIFLWHTKKTGALSRQEHYPTSRPPSLKVFGAHAPCLIPKDITGIAPMTPKSRVAESASSYRTKLPRCTCSDCQIDFGHESEVVETTSELYATLNDTDVRARLSGFIEMAAAAKESLKDTQQEHGNIIISRWKNMSHAKRQAILNKIQPPIAPLSGLDTCCLCSPMFFSLGNRDGITRKQILLPWMSIDRLAANESLLFALLHLRTEYALYEWATFDHSQLRQPWKLKYLKPEYSDKYVSMHGSNYGSIVKYDRDAAVCGAILQYPHASLVLETQALLMCWLRDIVSGILNGVDTSTVHGCSRWASEVAKGFKHRGRAEFWSNFANQPFSKPVGEGLDYIASVLRARQEEMEDHLYHLQASSAYLRQYIQSINDNTTFQSDAGADRPVVKHLLMETDRYCNFAMFQEDFTMLKHILSCSCHADRPRLQEEEFVGLEKALWEKISA